MTKTKRIYPVLNWKLLLIGAVVPMVFATVVVPAKASAVAYIAGRAYITALHGGDRRAMMAA